MLLEVTPAVLKNYQELREEVEKDPIPTDKLSEMMKRFDAIPNNVDSLWFAYYTQPDLFDPKFERHLMLDNMRRRYGLSEDTESKE